MNYKLVIPNNLIKLINYAHKLKIEFMQKKFEFSPTKYKAETDLTL